MRQIIVQECHVVYSNSLRKWQSITKTYGFSKDSHDVVAELVSNSDLYFLLTLFVTCYLQLIIVLFDVKSMILLASINLQNFFNLF